MSGYPFNCSDCGRFATAGSWASQFDFAAMQPDYDHERCPRCTEELGPALSNARPYNECWDQYEGRIESGEYVYGSLVPSRTLDRGLKPLVETGTGSIAEGDESPGSASAEIAHPSPPLPQEMIMSEAENPPAFPSDRTQQDTLKADRPWQPWERNFSGGRIGVQKQQGVNENWMILHVESGGATTTTSLRHHEAWGLALMLSPQLKARLEQLFNDKRATDAALHSLTWRECDTDLLRRIADERDCGPGCEQQGGWAHCPMIDRGECGFAEAESLRDLAKGIDLANATLEADVMRVVDSCGGAEQPDESADWSRGYNEALDAVEREMKRFFARHPTQEQG